LHHSVVTGLESLLHCLHLLIVHHLLDCQVSV
jgi:hypothetical protein